MSYWLFKSEPSEFSLSDLVAEPKKTAGWDGVRNYQSRNFMRDGMQRGDLGFFYHSNAKPTGIVGIVEVVSRAAYPDETAFDPTDKHYDPKSDPDDPRWWQVDVRYKRKLKRVITLAELKEQSALADFQLVKRGNRLSILPVTPEHWDYILGLE